MSSKIKVDEKTFNIMWKDVGYDPDFPDQFEIDNSVKPPSTQTLLDRTTSALADIRLKESSSTSNKTRRQKAQEAEVKKLLKQQEAQLRQSQQIEKLLFASSSRPSEFKVQKGPGFAALGTIGTDENLKAMARASGAKEEELTPENLQFLRSQLYKGYSATTTAVEQVVNQQPTSSSSKSKCPILGCGRESSLDGSALKTCDKCKTVFYCSREHQVAHWPIHKLAHKK
ncbi:MAG TPA: zinc finger MYND domain-containing protein [Rhabdochlamydiaceae bacterium]|nr:zinc finger MYND domain-containing protein [Rhabdochlamydiaceae bacterium]